MVNDANAKLFAGDTNLSVHAKDLNSVKDPALYGCNPQFPSYQYFYSIQHLYHLGTI